MFRLTPCYGGGRVSLLTAIISLVAIICLAISSVAAAQENSSSEADAFDGDAAVIEVLPDYLVVGAGGSGIQTALYLKKLGRSYTVLEKEHQVGSFWSTFPRFRELISVNKWVRNETQKFRYDWHSMLEAPLTMDEITSDYFPQADDWQKYMQKVSKMGELNVEFGIEIKELATDGSPCVILPDDTRRCAKHRVFVGTGLREKRDPYIEALGAIPYSKASKELAYHKRVCILGNGNSGFELAQNVMSIADRITMYGRHPHRFSAITRYTGDVRLKFSQALENFNGKLLDTVDHFTRRPIVKVPEAWNASQETIEHIKDALEVASFLNQFKCEVLFTAIGFESVVPGLQMSDSRFPKTEDWYAWSENPSIHFVGWLMHERDFRRGAGGFLSGYRYLIRNLMNHVAEVDYGIHHPYRVLTRDQAVEHVIARVQTADDLIILQDGVVIKDVLVRSDNGDDLYHYYEGITYRFQHEQLLGKEQIFSLYFAWGDGRKASTVFEDVIRYSNKKLLNYLLHPVIQVGGLVRNIQEDTEMAWTGDEFVSAIIRTVESAFDKDLSVFQPKRHYGYVREEREQPDGPGDYESCGIKPSIEKDVVNAIYTAALEGTPEAFQNVSDATAKWLPSLTWLD